MSKLRPLCLLVLLVCAGCDQEEVISSAELQSPTSMVQAGRTLLIANRGRSELSAFSLEGDSPGFVRAPNPIYPLAIPTAPLTQSIGAWTGPEGERTEPFALALSTVASQITVASTGTLAALGSFAVPDTALSVTVTAPVDGAPVRAVIAVVQGAQGNLYVADLARELEQNPAGLAEVVPQLAVSLGRSTPQAVVSSPTDASLLLVGDRNAGDDGLGGAGGLVVVDLAAKTFERFDVGGPVAAITFADDGTRAFGILDSDACVGGEPCSGVFGFDVAARAVLPTTGAAPIEIPGVARGIASGGVHTLTLPDGSQVGVGPLLMVSSTDGGLYLVDGGAMRLLDLDGDGASVVEQFHLEPDDTRSEMAGGPTDILLSEGAIRSERISVTYEGYLPSLRRRTGAIAGTTLTADVDFVALGVQPGDLLILEDAPETCTTRETAITTVAPGQLGLTAFDPSCVPSPTTYSVRVSGAYAVTGTLTGLLGRAAANSAFVYQGGYFHRPDGFDPARPALSFTMGAGDPRRGARYVLVTDSGIRPFVIRQNFFTMPGPVVYDPVLQRFYAAFLGGNGVLEVSPADVRDQSVEAGLKAFD